MTKPPKPQYLRMLRKEPGKLLIFSPLNSLSSIINYFFCFKDWTKLIVPDIPEGPLLMFRNILIDNNFTTSQVPLKVLNYRTDHKSKYKVTSSGLAAEKLQSFTPIPVGSIISKFCLE